LIASIASGSMPEAVRFWRQRAWLRAAASTLVTAVAPPRTARMPERAGEAEEVADACDP
jgi:hypothetical protein